MPFESNKAVNPVKRKIRGSHQCGYDCGNTD